MKKILLLSAAALLAMGCATATTGTAAKATADVSPTVMTAMPGSTAGTPAAHAANPQSRDQVQGMPSTLSAVAFEADRLDRPTSKAKGRTPQDGYASTLLNPAASAFGGVDNNPVEGAGLDISEVKNYEKRVGVSDRKRNVRNTGKSPLEEFTKASWIEGNNPAEDGTSVARNQMTATQQEEETSRSVGKPNGKLVEKLSPLTKIANNNPVDETSSALEIPRNEAATAQERFENAAARTVIPVVVTPRMEMPTRAPLRDMNSNAMRDRFLERRNLASDNNPFSE